MSVEPSAGNVGARVSIIVRTKDRPELLQRALGSITSQTMGDWECVIVNDGGDPTIVDEQVSALAPDHRRKVRVVHHAEPRGRWSAANAGVLATTAGLIVLHDDDDSWHPRFLEGSVGYLDTHPERNGVVSRIEILWEEKINGEYVTVRKEIFQPHLTAPLLGDTLLFNRYVPIAFVYRRTLHQELGLYDDSLPVVGDWAFNLKVLTRGPLEYLGTEPLAYWHQRAGSSGADGNSVIGAGDDHAATDALLRDDALRTYVSENGLGFLPYLTRFIDARLVDVENGIRREVRESALWFRAKDKARRTAGALLRRRDT